MNLEGYPVFRRTVKTLTGIDLDAYKGNQLERRLQGILRRVGVPDLIQYSRLLQSDSRRLQEFRDFLTINVTEFFRNPDRFEDLKHKVLPALLRERRPLRIWSAGCSTGAEPYSIAIILDEIDPGGRHDILATDVDATALAQAREAVYQEREMKEVSPARRRRYFTETPSGWQVVPHIRSAVRFVQHNLLSDPFPGDLDLIVCRNVVIYFAEEAKTALYERFRRSLRPGGVLFVGGTESLLRARELGFTPLLPFFYTTLPASRPEAETRQGRQGTDHP
ncbi:CheR family methyltransferase [Caldinitratiruptor microaerophilus]|uniref:protein-glutamate O-methyltransferase n=1 Tax=Caldinitratiruptor microaerophilus TaxID=671077 RepID=A0AA35G8M6_9FIRM|nr:protein-glutamate O-methyltransferase CheR [Caldinitratiruptor microaerophilus]BDG59419.1 chemotaxis protein CheR [Caldinitratiruptor microaerophilus]